ncbi:MAG: hypothetical protein M1407_04995 [Deltaproteobacteria bacterium]|nr:hypothetical protein [Deltaproteobacteria bacterium]
MKINILRLVLNTENNLRENDAEKIRGYLGDIFWDNPAAHQHNQKGGLIYQYPRVQYKVIDGLFYLIGFEDGLEIIKKTFQNLKSINLCGKWEEILHKGLVSYMTLFSITQERIFYYFQTPWLALNEKNYEIYQELRTWEEKKIFLEKILVGNIISISKSLGYTVQDRIYVNINKTKMINTKLKGIPMIGFTGSFFVNFEIPDYWGIGKSVSRGFGTIIKQKQEIL